MRYLGPVHFRYAPGSTASPELEALARVFLGQLQAVHPNVATKGVYRQGNGWAMYARFSGGRPIVDIHLAPEASVDVQERQVRVVYQFLSTGPALYRDTDGTPFGDAVRVMFAINEDAQMVAIPAASGSTLEIGDWPVFDVSSHLFNPQPVILPDSTFASPEAFWPDAGAREGWRSSRVLFGPRMDGAAAVAMSGHNSGTRARQVSVTHPYAERGDGAPLLWYNSIDADGVTVRMPGLDAVHGHGVIRASHPEYGKRDLLVAVDSYSRLWVTAPGGVAQAVEMPLPAWVFLGPDDGDVSERAAYKWRFSPDGTKLCAVVFERHAPVVDSGAAVIYGERRTSVFLDSGTQESSPLLLDAGGLVEMSLSVELTGRARDEFRPIVTLFRARRTADLGCGIMAADYAWSDGALVLATIDIYVPDEFNPLDWRGISVLTVAREGEAAAFRGKLYDNHIRAAGAEVLDDFMWTGINGLDLRALSGCFVVKSWRQTLDHGSRIAHTLDVSILVYFDGVLTERVDSNSGAFPQWQDIDIPAGMHRLEIGEQEPISRVAARASITAGNGATLVDSGLWRYGPVAAAYNDYESIRAMTVHPDGHYAVCTTPTMTYTGVFVSSGVAPYTYAIEGFGSVTMDVIAVRRLDELHRLRHIDSLNAAFGHEWQYSDFALKVRPYGATSFKVSTADDRGEAIYSARYVFHASEYDEQFRPASLSSRSWSRSLSVDAPILAAQSIFWWRAVS